MLFSGFARRQEKHQDAPFYVFGCWEKGDRMMTNSTRESHTLHATTLFLPAHPFIER